MTTDLQVAALVMGNLNLLATSVDDEQWMPCCATCCGPCQAMIQMLDTGDLDRVLRATGPDDLNARGYDWWDHAIDGISREFLDLHVTRSCEVCKRMAADTGERYTLDEVADEFGADLDDPE